MTTSLPSAARAAADVQRYRPILDSVQHSNVGPNGGRTITASMIGNESGDWVRHSDYLLALAKLAEVEKERDEALAERDEMAGRYNMEMEIHAESRGETIKAIRDWTVACTERDSALTRADSAEALLREAYKELNEYDQQPLADRISAHLANRGTP